MNSTKSITKNRGSKTMTTTKTRFAALANSVAAGAFLTLAALLLIGTPALGAPIPVSVLGNLNNPASSEVGSLSVGKVNVALAQGFTSGTDSLLLSLVKIRLDLKPDNSVTTNSPSVQLWSSIGSGTSAVPSALLASFTADPALPSGLPFGSAAAIYDFAGWYDLAASTNYWVVVRDALPTVGKFSWNLNDPNELPPAELNSSGFSYLAGARSTTNGLNWSQNTSTVPATSMELVAVPEPPTVILAGLGVAAVIANGYRRRLRRKGVDSEFAAESMEGAVALTA
jgi:hypothetical protein